MEAVIADRPVEAANWKISGADSVLITPEPDSPLACLYDALNSVNNTDITLGVRLSVHLEDRNILPEPCGFTGHQAELRFVLSTSYEEKDWQQTDWLAQAAAERIFGPGQAGRDVFRRFGGVFESAQYHAENVTLLVWYLEPQNGELQASQAMASGAKVKCSLRIAPTERAARNEAARINPLPEPRQLAWPASLPALPTESL